MGIRSAIRGRSCPPDSSNDAATLRSLDWRARRHHARRGFFSKSAIGTVVQVNLEGSWVDIDGLQNVQIQSPEVTTSSVAVLAGGGVQRVGSALPETLTADRIANFTSAVQDALYEARRTGAELSFRVRTGAPQNVVPVEAADKVAIAQTGILTLTPAGTNTTIAALRDSRLAIGHFFVVGNKQYRIVSIAGSPDVVTVQDEATGEAPAQAVAAADYTVVNPRWQVQANAHVTQVGTFNAATDGNPIGDSFSLAFIQNLPNWTPLFA